MQLLYGLYFISGLNLVLSVSDKDSAKRLSGIVDDACFLLSEYNKRLSDELEDRKKVAKMLRAFIIAQRNQLSSAEKRLQVIQIIITKF